MLQPLVRRTWAPAGQTPLQVASARHDRLSVISALTVSPYNRRLGLYFQIHHENINADRVECFLGMVQRKIQRRMIIIWDRLNAHRTAERRLRARNDMYEFEYLPPYSPELNPVEQLWSHSKWVDLANCPHHDIFDMYFNVLASLTGKQSEQQLLRSFFDHANLPL